MTQSYWHSDFVSVYPYSYRCQQILSQSSRNHKNERSTLNSLQLTLWFPLGECYTGTRAGRNLIISEWVQDSDQQAARNTG